MKAIESNGYIRISDLEGSPDFLEIFGGLGWADAQGTDHFATNWFAVIGVEPDETFTVILEESGSISSLAQSMIAAKDNLYVKRIYADTNNTAMVRNLKSFDGLFSYEIIGRHHNVPVWKTDQSHWPTFKSRSHVAALTPVKPEIITTPQLGLDLIHYLSDRNRFRIRHSCPRSSWLFRQKPPFTNLFRHPLFHAVVQSIYTFIPASSESHQSTTVSTSPKLPKFGFSK